MPFENIKIPESCQSSLGLAKYSRIGGDFSPEQQRKRLEESLESTELLDYDPLQSAGINGGVVLRSGESVDPFSNIPVFPSPTAVRVAQQIAPIPSVEKAYAAETFMERGYGIEPPIDDRLDFETVVDFRAGPQLEKLNKCFPGSSDLLLSLVQITDYSGESSPQTQEEKKAIFSGLDINTKYLAERMNGQNVESPLDLLSPGKKAELRTRRTQISFPPLNGSSSHTIWALDSLYDVISNEKHPLRGKIVQIIEKSCPVSGASAGVGGVSLAPNCPGGTSVFISRLKSSLSNYNLPQSNEVESNLTEKQIASRSTVPASSSHPANDPFIKQNYGILKNIWRGLSENTLNGKSNSRPLLPPARPFEWDFLKGQYAQANPWAMARIGLLLMEDDYEKNPNKFARPRVNGCSGHQYRGKNLFTEVRKILRTNLDIVDPIGLYHGNDLLSSSEKKNVFFPRMIQDSSKQFGLNQDPGRRMHPSLTSYNQAFSRLNHEPLFSPAQAQSAARDLYQGADVQPGNRIMSELNRNASNPQTQKIYENISQYADADTPDKLRTAVDQTQVLLQEQEDSSVEVADLFLSPDRDNRMALATPALKRAAEQQMQVLKEALAELCSIGMENKEDIKKILKLTMQVQNDLNQHFGLAEFPPSLQKVLDSWSMADKLETGFDVALIGSFIGLAILTGACGAATVASGGIAAAVCGPATIAAYTTLIGAQIGVFAMMPRRIKQTNFESQQEADIYDMFADLGLGDPSAGDEIRPTNAGWIYLAIETITAPSMAQPIAKFGGMIWHSSQRGVTFKQAMHRMNLSRSSRMFGYTGFWDETAEIARAHGIPSRYQRTAIKALPEELDTRYGNLISDVFEPRYQKWRNLLNSGRKATETVPHAQQIERANEYLKFIENRYFKYVDYLEEGFRSGKDTARGIMKPSWGSQAELETMLAKKQRFRSELLPALRKEMESPNFDFSKWIEKNADEVADAFSDLSPSFRSAPAALLEGAPDEMIDYGFGVQTRAKMRATQITDARTVLRHEAMVDPYLAEAAELSEGLRYIKVSTAAYNQVSDHLGLAALNDSSREFIGPRSALTAAQMEEVTQSVFMDTMQAIGIHSQGGAKFVDEAKTRVVQSIADTFKSGADNAALQEFRLRNPTLFDQRYNQDLVLTNEGRATIKKWLFNPSTEKERIAGIELARTFPNETLLDIEEDLLRQAAKSTHANGSASATLSNADIRRTAEHLANVRANRGAEQVLEELGFADAKSLATKPSSLSPAQAQQVIDTVLVDFLSHLERTGPEGVERVAQARTTVVDRISEWLASNQSKPGFKTFRENFPHFFDDGTRNAGGLSKITPAGKSELFRWLFNPENLVESTRAMELVRNLPESFSLGLDGPILGYATRVIREGAGAEGRPMTRESYARAVQLIEAFNTDKNLEYIEIFRF